MSDFLHRLAARALGRAPVARPVPGSFYGNVPSPPLIAELESPSIDALDNDNKGLEIEVETEALSSAEQAANSFRAPESTESPSRPNRTGTRRRSLSVTGSLPRQDLSDTNSNTWPKESKADSPPVPKSPPREARAARQSSGHLTNKADGNTWGEERDGFCLAPRRTRIGPAVVAKTRVLDSVTSTPKSTQNNLLAETHHPAATELVSAKQLAHFSDSTEFQEQPKSAPSIQVTIGRVEVHAIMPPTPNTSRIPANHARPALSLEEYAKRRSREKR